MGYMFNNCSSMTALNIENFNTSKLTNASSMFYGTNVLSSIKIGEEFDFDGNAISNVSNRIKFKVPPTPATTRKWIREDEYYGPYTVEELRDNFTSDMAGTWYCWYCRISWICISVVTIGILSVCKAVNSFWTNDSGHFREIDAG